MSFPRDAAGGHVAHAHAQAQAPALPVGAAAREFIPNTGDVPVVDPTEEALDQEGRTIAKDVYTMTPSALGYFGPTPTIRAPQHTPNPTRGYTPHLMVDYHHQVAKIHCRCAQHLYDEPKDLRIEYQF